MIREFDVFSRVTRNKEYDPMTLKSKVDFLINEYLQISTAEQDSVKLIGFNKHTKGCGKGGHHANVAQQDQYMGNTIFFPW